MAQLEDFSTEPPMTGPQRGVMERIVNALRSNGVSRTVVALAIARMVDALGNSILFIAIPLYVADLEDSLYNLPTPVIVGILISMYGLVNALAQPFMGALSDRIGRRKLLIQIGTLLIALATLGYVWTRQFTDIFILQCIRGVSIALVVTSAMGIMARITKKETRGGSMGVYSVLRMIGFATGPLVGGYLHDHYGFTTVFVTGAIAVATAVVLIHFWVKDSPSVERNDSLAKRPFKIVDRELISPGILAAGLSTFMMAISFSLVITLENEFNARLSIDAFGFGFAFSALMWGRLVFQLPLGRLSDHIGRKPLILGGLVLMAVATLLIGQVTSLFQLVVLRILQGTAAAAISSPAMAVVADLSQAGGEGRQMTVVTVGFGFGSAVGPLIAGVLGAIFFEFPFWAGGALCVLAALFVLKYMPETVQGSRALFKVENTIETGA